MGKRKSSKKPQPKKALAMPLDKSFRCLFCQHPGTVSCKMDPKTHIARLSCRDCQQHFSVEYNHLTEPIDVYAAWIDACQAVNDGAGSNVATDVNGRKRPVRDTAGQDGSQEEEEEDDDDLYERQRAQQANAQKKRVTREDDEDDEDEDLPDLAGVDKRKQQQQKEQEDALLEEDDDEDDQPSNKRRRVVEDDDDDDDE